MREYLVTDEIRRTFREDGVVHLPGALDPTWIDLISAGIQRNLNAPGPYSARFYEGTDREFYHDFCNYAATPEYQLFLRESTLVETVASILGTEKLWLFFDQIFIKDG